MALLRLLFVLLAFAPLASAGPTGFLGASRPQDPSIDGKTIVAIDLEGNQRLTRDQVLSTLRLKVGQPYTAADAQQDVKDVYARFGARLELRAEEREGGVAVHLTVSESALIARVEVRGVEPERGRELMDAVALTAVRQSLEAQVRDRAREMEAHLKDEGRYFATVEVSLEDSQDGKVAVLTVNQGEKVEVEKIEFTGCEQVDPSALLALMNTDTTTLWIFESYLKKDALDRDLVELENWVRREGFREGKVELAELRFNDDKTKVTIVIKVTEGPLYTVEAVEITGASVLPQAELEAALELKAGAPLRGSVIAKDQQRLRDRYGAAGYVRAEIVPKIVYSESGTTARVQFVVTEHEQKRVRDVRILGNAGTLDEVIRRRMTLEPGDLATSTELKRSTDRLRALGYFNDADGRARVDVKFQPTGDPLLEDVYVDVEEADSGRLFFSLFASSDLGLFGGIQLEKNNFDITDTPSSWDPVTLFSELYHNEAFHGGGQQLYLSILPGTSYSTYKLTFVEPYLFGPDEFPYSLRVDLYGTTSRLEDDFDERRYGLALTLSKEIDDHWSAGVTERSELVDIADVEDDAPGDVEDVEGGNFIETLGVFARFQDLDSPYHPTRGWEAGGRYEILFGSDAGERVVLDGAWHLPLHEDDERRQHTLSLRGAFGASNGFSGDLPFFERFSGGGSIGDFPVRGFEYRGIGPEKSGVHLGGNFGYMTSLEYEFPLYATYDPVFDEHVEYVRGVTFLDLGAVEDDFGDVFGRTRMAVGAGLRIRLPFLGPTPLAVDLGVPLLERSDDDTELLSVRVSTRLSP